MLLRRVMKHVRDQNWFAVGIDFLIVVTGVFIGIQVANWNAERQLAAQERAYLAQLREEILGNYSAVDLRMRYNGEVVAAGERALERSRLRQDLQFWLGQNILAERAFPGVRSRGEAALRAVSAEIGVTFVR